MADFDALYAAIQRVYQAVLSDDLWTEALMLFSEVVVAQRTMLVTESAGGRSLIAATGMGAGAASLIYQKLSTNPPAWIASIPDGVPMRQTSCVTDAEFERSEIYQQTVRPVDGFYGMVAPLSRAMPGRTYFIAGRVHGASDFGPADVAAAAAFIPHLHQALRIHAHLAGVAQRYDLTCHLMDAHGIGLIWLDANLRAVDANRKALDLVDRNDGVRFGLTRIGGTSPVLDATLHATIARAVLMQGGHYVGASGVQNALRCRLVRQAPLSPLSVSVIPVDAWRHDSPPSARIALVLTEEGQGNASSAGSAARLAQLTSRENDLLDCIVQGRSLADSAEHLGIRKETARTYLKRIFAKTDTHRQAELVALMLAGR
nr:helix-turn-helix transcriptional regulator [uncultured Cupriavidus sp.]